MGHLLGRMWDLDKREGRSVGVDVVERDGELGGPVEVGTALGVGDCRRCSGDGSGGRWLVRCFGSGC